MATASNPEIALLPNVFSHDYSTIRTGDFESIYQMGCGLLELGATDVPFPEDLINRLRDRGFRFLGHGAGLWTLEQRTDEYIRQAQSRSEEYIFCYWPWLDAAEHLTLDQCRESAVRLNRLGAAFRNAGLKFAFHNHAVEFQEIEGKTVCEHLLEQTDPERVSLELDLFHLVASGHDPMIFLKNSSFRVSVVHVNAMDGYGSTSVVGDGIAHFREILHASPSRYWVIEGHNQPDPLRYIEASYARLSSFAMHPNGKGPISLERK